MKKIMITMALVVLILSNVCGHSLMNALADETELPESQKYYTSIEIQKGDTLWGIADEYAGSCRMSTADYVTELKEDVIHSGQHLTIMYCVPVSEVLAER